MKSQHTLCIICIATSTSRDMGVGVGPTCLALYLDLRSTALLGKPAHVKLVFIYWSS
jgi:hypothetical protein